MHYLVTGGCGFIGSHLVERLLADGHTVTVIDDLSTGKRENIPATAKLQVGDITTPGIFDTLVKQVDGCFHLAAIVSVQRSAEEWLRTHQVTCSGTVALFDALARHKRKIPVVLASSAAIYGDGCEMPLKEMTRQMPLSAYGADKLACELHAFIASSLHNIPTVALRFFNVYGARQDPSSPYSGVISILIDRMKNHLPVTIHGDGEQSRDFIYVGDIANALVLSMIALESGRLTHGVFNACTGKQTSINELARTLAAITHPHSAIAHDAPRPGEVRMSVGDPSSARQLLGFSASVSLTDGLKKIMES